MNAVFAVFIGGGLGSVCRYALSLWLGKHSSGFPSATFAANILSCIVLALAWMYAAKHIDMNPELKLMILVGFCGGFSTFSTFSVETFRLLENQQFVAAFLYVIASIFACLLLLWVIFRSFA